MRTGVFFETDGEPMSGKGHVYFNYLALRKKSGATSPYDYPISLKITEYSLEFQFNGYLQAAFGQQEYKECLVLRVPLNLSHNPELSVNQVLGLEDTGFNVGEGYSFYKFDNLNTYRNSVNPQDNEKVIEQQVVLSRHLLVDFLYDFVHSDVFTILPNYKYIKELMYDDVFIYALISKCEFHYLLNEFFDKYKEGKEENHEARILAKLLYSSEQKWLSIIHDKQFDEVFSFSNIWFKNIEQEYSDVLFQRKDADYKRKIWYSILTKKSSTNSKDTGKEVYKKCDQIESHSSQIRRHNEVIVRMSVQWYIGRYNFHKALSCLSLILPGTNNYLFRIIIFTIALVVVGLHVMFLVDVPPALHICDLVSFAFMQISSIIIVLAMIVVAIYCVCVKSFRMLYLLMPRLTIGLISAWVLLLTSKSIMVFLTDNYFGSTMIYLLLFSGILMFLYHIMVLNTQIPNYRINIKWGWHILPIRVLVLSAIAFIYTFIIGVILTNSLYPIMLKNGIVQSMFRPVENNLLVDPPKGSPSMEYIQSCIASIDTVTANPLFVTGKQHHSPESVKLLTSGNDPFSKYSKRLNVPIIGMTKYHEVFIVRHPLFGRLLIFPIVLIFASFATVFLGVFIELLVHKKPIIEPSNTSDISKVDT